MVILIACIRNDQLENKLEVKRMRNEDFMSILDFDIFQHFGFELSKLSKKFGLSHIVGLSRLRPQRKHHQEMFSRPSFFTDYKCGTL